MIKEEMRKLMMIGCELIEVLLVGMVMFRSGRKNEVVLVVVVVVVVTKGWKDSS